jgi:hypothetical protein
MPHTHSPPSPQAGPGHGLGRGEARQEGRRRAVPSQLAGRVAACMTGWNGKGFTTSLFNAERSP